MFKFFAVAWRFGFWAKNATKFTRYFYEICGSRFQNLAPNLIKFTATARQNAGYRSKFLSKFTQDFCRFMLQNLRPRGTTKFNPKGGKWHF
ncbi:hypothetical protein [Campylobacter showae]|uniref:Uncharacterized protein n=1 Tax=Campylobacter showae CC57C TaxID=1073353 RepID=M3JG13_9BACT|nr:hypothetical protein [Campylobacter showae]EMG31597.1 hypothetical protein H740_00432 [Campylobacter showae CC57C]